MNRVFGAIIVVALIYLSIVETAQLVAIIKAADFAQQELSSRD